MDDTLKVIHRSNVRSALNPHAKNLWLDPLEPGDVATPIRQVSSWLSGWWGDFTSNACHWSLGTYRSYLPHG
jgi:hypothetical protein